MPPKQKPLLSVIIPTLNEARYIARCLQSLENQTIPRKRFEVIVSDTRSKDRTVQIAESCADRVVVHDGVGAGFGKNVGARFAKSNRLAFLDGDSIASPTWVDAALHGLKQYIACTGPVGAFDAKSAQEKLFFWGWDAAVHWSALLDRVLLPGFNTAIRKTAFHRVGGFFNENRINEDLDLSQKLWKLGRVGFHPHMRVRTSARRVKEIGLAEYVLAGARFVFLKQDKTWQAHRKDAKAL